MEQNDFGIHEFLDFCRLASTEPLIVVNTGFGDSFSAAQEVEYVNGGPETPMGQWRTANGRREPWDVMWWGVGNEMFGVWQLGYMALEQYVHKHNEVERRMRNVDPRIKTIGVGEAGPWSEGIMRHCADNMDLISEHFYCQEKPDIVEHVLQMPAAIRAKADAHRKYRAEFESLKGKDIRIAMDEWNYWYGPEVFGELGTRYFMKDALGIAAGLHEYYRQSDIVFMAQYAQTVNVIGAIKTTPDRRRHGDHRPGPGALPPPLRRHPAAGGRRAASPGRLRCRERGRTHAQPGRGEPHGLHEGAAADPHRRDAHRRRLAL